MNTAFSVITTNRAGLIAYTPSRRIARCRPRWPRRVLLPSPSRNATASWKLLQGTTRPSVWLGGQRLAVAGVHVTDLALRNGHQRRRVDAVLPAPVAEVDAAAQQLGLVAGLAVERDDVALPTEPLADHSFSTTPTRSFGMNRTVSHVASRMTSASTTPPIANDEIDEMEKPT